MLRPRSAAYCPRPFRRRDELSFYYRVRIANDGGWWLVKRGLRLLWDLLLWTLLLPATVPLHCLGYRKITVYSERIGHLAGEPDCLLKDRVLRELPTCPKRFFLASRRTAANPHLVTYWQQHLPVVTGPVLCRLLAAMSRFWLMREDISRYLMRLYETQAVYAIQAEWGTRAPILRLSTEDETWGEQIMERLGLPRGCWYVCVHIREAGFSPIDDPGFTHRNSLIDSVLPAMQEIVDRGGYCVRLGNPAMRPLARLVSPTSMEIRVIDYAHHPLRSPRLDVLLCARARFFLGDTSGLAFLSTAFGVPSALVNMTPISTLAPLPGDLSIPKLLSAIDGRLLPLREAFQDPLADYRYGPLFEARGIRMQDNSPDEILDLVREMLARLAGVYEESEEERAMRRTYASLFHPGHYSFGAASSVGGAFLKKYRSLLE
ncbi:MAG: TIGR04372 family glycosyltransferase [Acidobacteriota bacterium]